jgi:fructose-specific component phosphotransferase system IIB-like protein
MKIIIALTILISLPSFAADHHYEKNVSDGSTIEFKTDESMDMSGKNVVVINLDENMEMPGDGTGVFILDENMQMPDGSTIEFKTDESMDMSGKNVVVIKLDENMQMPDGSTIEFKTDENMDMSGRTKERMMNNPNYLMNRKECKEVKDGVAGFLLMSDGIWKEIKKDPEDKDKWTEVMALSSLASNYSNIYDVWCKGSAHLGMKKMKIKAKKYQKNNKDKKDKKDKKN